MPRIDVVILTESRYEHPAVTDDYINRLLDEDHRIDAALRRQGLTTARVDWARPDFDWTSARAALFRSTWDYFFKPRAFVAWLDRVAPLTRLINDVRLVRWNLDKHYLRDLAERGVAVPATRYLEQGDAVSLPGLLRDTGWAEAVLKPVVGGAARETYRIDADSAEALEGHVQRLLRDESLMLQPFLRRVPEEGEVSLIVIAGEVSHAVRKRAKPGDFRVQDDHGGTVHPHDPSPAETDLARRAVAACRPAPLYARVDLVRDNEGGLVVMELELIEPELFFRFHPPAAERLAELVARRVGA